MNPAYQSWLEQRGFERRTVQSYISDVRRIERAYGNLDEIYDRDKLTVLLDLEYSKDDERENRPNSSKITVDAFAGRPSRVRNSIASETPSLARRVAGSGARRHGWARLPSAWFFCNCHVSCDAICPFSPFSSVSPKH